MRDQGPSLEPGIRAPVWTHGSESLFGTRDQGLCLELGIRASGIRDEGHSLEGFCHRQWCTLCSPQIFTLYPCSPSYWLWDKSTLWFRPVKFTVTCKKVLFSCLLWAARKLWVVFVQRKVGPPGLVWAISVFLTPAPVHFMFQESILKIVKELVLLQKYFCLISISWATLEK